MEKNWYARLLEAIEADQRSLKKLSADIGQGQNYIQQMIKDGKEPGSDKLAKLLDALGRDAALYVMTGVSISAADLDFIRAFKAIPPAAQAQAVAFFRALLAPEDTASPDPAAPGSSATTDE